MIRGTTGDRIGHLRRRDDRVLIYGHRGARGIFAENTMPGFDYLAQIGIDAVEFDVLVTADGVPVLTHNPALSGDTTRDAAGAWLGDPGPVIFDISAHDLSAYDVGAIRHGTRYHVLFPDQARLSGVAIPTLESFCAWAIRQPGMVLDIEIKSFATRPHLTPPPDTLVAMVLDPMAQHGLLGRSLVQSFDWRVVHAAARARPDLPRGHLTLTVENAGTMTPNLYDGAPWLDGAAFAKASVPQMVAQAGGDLWCPFFRDLRERDVAEAHALGLAVNVWTVNEVADMDRMIDYGVDGIITDLPARAQNVLSARGMHWRAA